LVFSFLVEKYFLKKISCCKKIFAGVALNALKNV